MSYDKLFVVQTNIAAGRIEYARMQFYCRYCSTFEKSRDIAFAFLLLNRWTIKCFDSSFESAENYIRHYRTRVYYQWISLRDNCM